MYQIEIIKLRTQGFRGQEIYRKLGSNKKQYENFITRYNKKGCQDKIAWNREWTNDGFSLTYRKEVRLQVKYNVIYQHREQYPISSMCRFFDVSRSEYYGYVQRIDIVQKIKECQDKCDRTYGYHRVHIWLERQGIHRNPKIILRTIQKYTLLSSVRRKKYRNYGNALHKYPNLLNRDFTSTKPN